MPILGRGALALAGSLVAGCLAPPQGAPPAPDPTPVPTMAPMVIPRSSGMTTLDEHFADQDVQVVLPTNVAEGAPRPLLLFFHSYDRDHTQLARLTRLGRFASERGWIAACGDLAGPSHWGNARALELHRALLHEMLRRYRVDPTRIYLVGFSMGGGSALLAAMEAGHGPDRPAAVASSQGFTDLGAMRSAADGLYAESIATAYGGALAVADRDRGDLVARAGELQGIPIYLEHGDADRYVPVDQSRRLAAGLEALGEHPILSIFPGLGHGEATLHEGPILDFLEAHHRP